MRVWEEGDNKLYENTAMYKAKSKIILQSLSCGPTVYVTVVVVDFMFSLIR